MNNDKQPLQRFLALDTSTACLAMAVMENERVLNTIKAAGERNHSVHLIPLAQEALSKSGIDGSQLNGIAVGVGPGSYTGTRISVTAAKTLAWAWQLPIVGISSLHALAWSIFETEGLAEEDRRRRWLVPLMDARRGQAYTALFAAEGAKMPVRLKGDAIRLMQEWVKELEAILKETAHEEKPDEVWFVGDVEKHEQAVEALRPLLGDGLRIVHCDMEGAPVGKLGAARLLHGEQDELHTLVPNYTQLAEAEKMLRKP